VLGQPWGARVGLRNPLFHVTGIWAAAKILKSKTFQLAAFMNTSERVLSGRRHKIFYLSTSRTLLNRYRNAVGYVSVTLELNRDWFEQRFQMKPVDYWGGDWKHASTPRERMSEKEERIFHDKPTITMPNLSQAINAVYLYVEIPRLDKERDSRHIRALLIEAKKTRIPVYLFTDRDSYYTGNIRKSVPLRQLIALLEIVKEDHWGRSNRDGTEEWRELFWKKSKKELSPKAQRAAYRMVYNNYTGDVLRGLEADLHNSKANAIEMRKMAMIWKKLNITTIKEFYEFLSEKWNAIYEAERS
jgi:hypothetical protein